jgi:protease IV
MMSGMYQKYPNPSKAFWPHFAGYLSSALMLLFSFGANAQGLSESISQTASPNAQTAGVDNLWAMDTNPAGLAYIDTFELVGGYHGVFNDQNRPLHQVRMATGLAVMDGFVLASGLTYNYFHDENITSFARNTASAAFNFDRTLAVGAQLHTIIPSQKNFTPAFRSDFGVQLHATEWLASGFAIEGLGLLDEGDRTTARFGISLRPLYEYLTLGLDARVVPGSHLLTDDSYFMQANIVPALTARLHVGGVALTAGGTIQNLISRNDPLGYQVGLGLEVNTAHLGAMVLGNVRDDMSFETGTYARISAESYSSIIPDFNEWVRFTLTGSGSIEQKAETVLEELLAESANPIAVLAGLDRAARDESIQGVIIRLKSLSVGWGKASELRNAILLLRENGKKVVVHMNGGDDKDIYLASAADRIYLTPGGSLSLNGLQIVLTYMAETLRKLGINATAVTAGEYKSAPRTFVANEPNEAELEVQNILLDELYKALVDAISEGRNIKKEDVSGIIDMGGLTADQAVENRIIDALIYSQEISKQIKKDFDLSREPRPIDGSSFLDNDERSRRWTESDRIAIIPVMGNIQMSRGGGGFLNSFSGESAGAEQIVEAIYKAKQDSSVRAVIIRVDSPGGDALASDLIWKAVMDLREEKPVIASMGDTAASGGYYIASAGQEIFAEPHTITGSIGVFTLMFDAEDLIDDIGVSNFELHRGALPGPSLMRQPTDKERESIQGQVDWVYESFLSAIEKGRKMKREKLLPLAGGRVWTGAQAYERGLVDNLGGMKEATARAKQLAGMAPDENVELSILTGRDEIVPRISTAVRALTGTNADEAQLRRLVRIWIGPQTNAALAGLDGQPMAASPVHIRIE